MNKFLVKVYVPLLDSNYDVWIPNSKRVKDIVYYISAMLKNLTDGEFEIKNYDLINRFNGNIYDYDLLINETDIKKCTELIIM